MRHYETLLFPILLLLDYLLTVLGAHWSERRYRFHFKLPHYELNPLWQKSIDQKRWFNPKFLVVLTFMSILSLCWLLLWTEPNPWFEFMLGFVLVMQATVIGAHVSNLLVFRHMDKCPEDVIGEITLGQRWALIVSQYRLFVVLLPLIVIAAFSGSTFVYGGMCGVIAFMLLHGVWRWRSTAARRLPGAQGKNT